MKTEIKIKVTGSESSLVFDLINYILTKYKAKQVSRLIYIPEEEIFIVFAELEHEGGDGK